MSSSATAQTEQLAAVAERARRLYAAAVAEIASAPAWWTAVVLTASSARQAERYRAEIQRRRDNGKIPGTAQYLVVPDLEGRRIGSGGATIQAVGELVSGALFRSGQKSAATAPAGGLAGWWAEQKVLLIHCGGDSRRLPQYSPSGKLFSAVPVATPWGEASTVFDEMLALSSVWAERLPSGLVVGSGDVILTFDAQAVDWSRPGVSGVGLLQAAEVGTAHGVYISDDRGRVYSFLQKPSVSEAAAAGGLREDGMVAVDSGLLRFDPEAARHLTELAGIRERGGEVVKEKSVLEMAAEENALTEIDLYLHYTMAMTGQWKPGAESPPVLAAVAAAMKNLPFWCSVVPGDFTHIGTTSLFRRLMTEDTEFSRLQSSQRRWGASRQPGVRSSGVVTDSVLSGGADLKAGTVVIECNLSGPVRAAAGAVLHGLEDIPGALEIPEDTVVHQLPVALPDGRRGVAIRVYGVGDDPKAPATNATWFGRPLSETLRALGIDVEAVWPETKPAQRTLWNARLFPLTNGAAAWNCAQWMMRLARSYSVEQWTRAERLSLASSAEWADGAALEAARARRLKAYWRITALSLVESGADIRPMLANAPGAGPLAETGEMLRSKAASLEASGPTEAASSYYIAGLFLGQAGLVQESEGAHDAAFRMVQQAVEAGSCEGNSIAAPWQFEEVTVKGPARIDLGGGWSDAPPFCLDWGGTVLNIALKLEGRHPIEATVRRLREPVVRCVSGPMTAEYRTCEEILQPARPGDEMSIPRTALRMAGIFRPGEPMGQVTARMGGGLEIDTQVDLPMGSGLGTSSILAACLVRALSELAGEGMENQTLSDRVMRLEQLMTTGGGWQDQAGGIFPGAKLLVSGPGLRQRVRVQPLAWSEELQRDFERHAVLYYTGIRRVARDLLRQVVGRYLARETACLQVLHSIKTLALEMAYAMQEGDWQHLGELLDRHWKLNQILDPNTTNAPINALLDAVRPYVYGAKLAGAGGGGFLVLIARSPEAADDLRRFLRESQPASGGAVHGCSIATEGLVVGRATSS
jgi:fucokinase